MAIAVVHDDAVVYAKGFGVKQLGASVPVHTHTLFQIGSTSKAFTSTLVAMLVDQGKLKWTDRVIDHDPEFAMYDAWVTREFMIQDLMVQHSGMAPYAGDLMALIGFDAAYIRRQIREMRPVSSFRSEFGYVNNLFLVASAIIERLTGTSWEENVRRRIFTPLGMAASSTGLGPFQQAADATHGHRVLDGQVRPLAMDYPFLGWVYTYAPAGGVNSTVLDMANWVRLHLARGRFGQTRLVGEANMDVVHAPRTALPPSTDAAGTSMSEAKSFYREGWLFTSARPLPIVWHNGDTNFMRAAVGLNHGGDLGVVILTNRGEVPLAEALVFELHDLYFGNPRSDWSALMYRKYEQGVEARRKAVGARPQPPAPPLSLEQYAGTFRNTVYGRATVATSGSGLSFSVGPRPARMLLAPWDRDAFLVSWPLVDAFAGDSGFARFVFGQDGKVMGVMMDAFSDVDNGLFERVAAKS